MLVPITALKVHPDSRPISPQRVAKIARDGSILNDPVEVNENLEVIEGGHRIEARRLKGLDKVRIKAREMFPAIQEQADKIMLERFNAYRSVVSHERWVDVGNGVYLGAYAKEGETKSHRPMLYMAHWASEHGVMVVYQALPPNMQPA